LSRGTSAALSGFAAVAALVLLTVSCGGDRNEPGGPHHEAKPAMGPPPRDGAPADRPNFLVIDIDSLRSDRVRASRGGEPLAPTLAALADRGAHFPNLISQGAWTIPAIGALLTGMDPTLPRVGADGRSSLVGGRPQLPKILEMYGYQTAGFWGDSAPAGFGEVVDLFQVRGVATQGEPWVYRERITSWLAADAREPFFAFVHEMDVYDPRPALPSAELHRHVEARDDCTAPRRNPEQALHALIPTLGLPAAAEHLIAHYDGAVSYYDGVVAAILEQLSASGLAERTVVMVLSDHGNDLLEHGAMGHGTTYDSVIRVPLIVVDPRLEGGGRELDTRIQTVDIAPTILDRAGIPAAHGMTGVSLLPLLGFGEGSYEERPAFSLSSAAEGSIRDGRHKLMQGRYRRDDRPGEIPAGEPIGEPITQLFDLIDDPGETRDLLDEQPDVAARLGERLDSWLATRAAGAEARPKIEIEPELKEKLQEDGYWELVAPGGDH
jgi:arylsulfatase A-like enzyme